MKVQIGPAEKIETDLLTALDSSTVELQCCVGHHVELINRLLHCGSRSRMGETKLPPVSVVSRETILKTAIQDAIDTLEESRKAFKSKTLERLRKKLTRVLMDPGMKES